VAIKRKRSDTSSPEGYDVVPAEGQEIHVGRNQVFENALIDLTTGEDVVLRVTGSNSVIRNVGFEGLCRGDQFLISIDAGPGEVRFEDVYVGDGGTRDGTRFGHGPGAVYLHHDNEADVTFRRCNVQGFPNNGFHCSNTADGSGSVHFDSCFGKNNGVATFRCASEDDLIENCVAYTDSTDYGHDVDYLETNGRPVWVWSGGTVTIRNSQFADGPYPNAVVAGADAEPGRVSFESGAYRGAIQCATESIVDVDADVSTDPDLSVPDGVPTSAEEAASASAAGAPSGATGDGAVRLPHAIRFDGRGTDGASSYCFQASAAAPADGPTAVGDVVRGRLVRGSVDDSLDAYWFDGDLEALSVRGDASVSVWYDTHDRDTSIES